MNTIIPGMAIAHLALRAHDIDRSIAFYTALGMEPYLTWGEGAKRIQMLKFGGGAGILELFNEGPEISVNGEYAGKYTHFAYAVEDVEAAYNVAIAAGAKSKIAPKFAPLDSKPFKVTLNLAFVYGPDGEEIEFFKEIRE